MRLPDTGFTVSVGLPLGAQSSASGNDRIDQAARGLEANFAKMLIGAMRTSSLGEDAMFPGAAGQYRDLYDGQLAESITRGKGLGLVPMIKRELQANQGAKSLDTSLSGRQWFSLADDARPPLAINPEQAGLALKLPEAVATRPAFPTPNALQRAMASYGNKPGTAAAIENPNVAQIAADIAPALSTLPALASTPAAVSKDAQAFVTELWPHAQRAAAELGVCPKTLLAQVALETGWGKHRIDGTHGSANNLFGIKATAAWKGERTTVATTEFANGTPRTQNADFRAYDSAQASFDDYVALLKHSPRYADALKAGTDGHRFARELQRAGYATDPNYAAKISQIADGPTLRRALDALPRSDA